ncbi:MAG: endonuclease [Betaproteobacteria bacterium]|nr:endonuclease [Betaproteobacteria bacterium]NBY04971.1 endonuclease [Betaproteobacteria bacterium]
MKTLRVATYNIHKGVQGLGPIRRLEIHNLGHAIEQLDADIVCLQEVRKEHRLGRQYFKRWPDMPQAEFLRPEGFVAVYRTNAFTRHGEHGNALLTRWPVVGHQHEDISDHQLEQRGLLHVELAVDGHKVHVIVVHLGLLAGSRLRQIRRLFGFVQREVPADAPLVVGGDFNDWARRLDRPLAQMGLRCHHGLPTPTFPSRMPMVQLDRIYARGLQPLNTHTPQGAVWARMSDHLPLIAEFAF